MPTDPDIKEEEDELTEYERRRLENIKRNRQELARLGLDQAAVPEAPAGKRRPAAKRTKREEAAAVPEEDRRR